MDQQISQRVDQAKLLVYLADLVVINILFWIGTQLELLSDHPFNWFIWNVAYLLSMSVFPPLAQNRLVKYEQIVTRAIQTTFCMFVIYESANLLDSADDFLTDSCPWWGILLSLLVVLVADRMFMRFWLKRFRRGGRNSRSVVFVGAGVNLFALYKRMTDGLSTGYKIWGYFEDQDSQNLGDKLPRLGTVADVIDYMEKRRPQLLFCNLPSARSEEILKIMNYCENNLIHFYSVPNVRNYVHRAMIVQYVDDIPVLSMRKEPLQNPVNKIIKRLFDIVFSLLFLVACFWWVYLIVALITKITMPGPVFFKQTRNGIKGKEFTCYKFRSMKVNKDADKIQATKDDPRKTKWGNIMRKTNIDELPQFINVLKGDMSVVGPRPHMVKHTQEYGALVDKYMVRHYAKPGITGWAQVTGSRGETSELWMMEERIEKDIWYVENWSFMLDIKIIVKTITNVLGGEKGNAY